MQLKVVSRSFLLSRGFVHSSRVSVNAEIRYFYPHDSNVHGEVFRHPPSRAMAFAHDTRPLQPSMVAPL
jgi:hypothetical protein